MSREIIHEAKVKLEGSTFLLHHKCGIIEKKASSATTDYSEEWKKTTYVSKDGKVSIPSLNLEAMMRDASKGHKIAKMAMTKVMASGAEVSEFDVPLLFNNKQITLDDISKNEWLLSCAAVVQKQRIMRVRTAIPPGWSLCFTVKIFNPLLKEDIMKDLLERAGYEVGLMDWRPGGSKPGKFGQFDLVGFEWS